MTHVVDEIFRRCDRSAVALREGTRTVTFGQLEARVDASARELLRAHVGGGVGRASRVGLHCPNGIEHIVWSLAILRCDAVLVPIAPELSHAERDEVVRTTGLCGLVCAGGALWHDAGVQSRELLGDSRALLLTGMAAEPAEDEAALADLHPALIRFSSGTTGQRKGVVLSHDTLLERVVACNAQLGIGPEDKVVWTLPMAHHFAVSIVLYLLHGATTVLAANHSPAEIQRTLSEHGGTVLYGPPYHHALLAAHPATTACPSLRLAVSTAAALSPETARRFHERLGVPLVQAMGIIEVGLPLINLTHAIDKPAAVGRPQPAFSCRLVAESGHEVPRGEIGELCLRGPGVFDAYLKPWTPRAQVLRDGWFPTGDLARVDDDGDITLVGRVRSVINVGGMKVFPEEVEQVIQRHPAVIEAHVFGTAHPSFGAVPVAKVVIREPLTEALQEAIERLCRATLSVHKIPRRIEQVDALHKTPSGKIMRT